MNRWSRFAPLDVDVLAVLTTFGRLGFAGRYFKSSYYIKLSECPASRGWSGWRDRSKLPLMVVRCVQPDARTNVDITICDPAVGTGGFVIAGYEWLVERTKGALARSSACRCQR